MRILNSSLASERSEQAQSYSCSIEISDTYVYKLEMGSVSTVMVRELARHNMAFS